MRDFVVRPYEDTHLKAVRGRPVQSGPLLMHCATCGKQFKLVGGRAI